MKNTNLFTPEEKDFIREMMNIGAGNAATALSQLLACTVNMEIPAVTVLPITEVSNLFAEPSVITTGVKMQMIGDIAGDLYFLLPSENVAQLVDRAQTALAGGEKSRELDLSTILEIANIMAGNYLTAIHDFCKLHISYTIPVMASDMLLALLDESLNAAQSLKFQTLIVVQNEFHIEGEKDPVHAHIIIIPDIESVHILVASIKTVQMALG